MHKLRSNGLGIVGLLFMALATTQCGDSSVRVIGGTNPQAGTFRGTTGNGGIVTLQVGSVESAILECQGETFGGSCNPVLPVENGSARGTCSGVFVDVTFTSSTEANINEISGGTNCDGGGSATCATCDGGPTRTPTPIIGVPTPTFTTGSDVPTPTFTPGSDVPTPTFTPGSDVPTPTVTSTPGGGDPNACPDAARVEGMGGDLKVLDSGWTGFGHNARVISDGVLTVNMNCTAEMRPCGVCNVSGPIDNIDAGNGTIDNKRCVNDSSVRCESSGDCPGGSCEYFFGGPLPLVAGGVQTCVFNRVTGNVSGTANVETGSFSSQIGLTSSVFTGISAESPCPQCNGDGASNDGVQGGTCSGGTRTGQACDVSGSSVEFGDTSLDCPMGGPGNAIGNLPINFNGSSGSESLILEANSPNCRALGTTTLKCACDTCPGSGDPCRVDADCGSAICGGLRCQGGPNNGDACTTPGISDPVCNPPPTQFIPCGAPGEPTKPNGCTDLTCNPIGSSTREGECTNGPFSGQCQPTESFRSCAGDGDCPLAGDSCVFAALPCFLDNGQLGGEIVAQGQAGTPVDGVSNGTVATTFCIGPVSASAVNAAAGLPGAGRVELPIQGCEISNGVVVPGCDD